MRELNVFKMPLKTNIFGRTIVAQSFYGKSEADKVIAEKDKEIAELKENLQAANEQVENLINSASNIMLFQDKVNGDTCQKLRHANYKRCLAEAETCFESREYWRYRYGDWNDTGRDITYKWRKVEFWDSWGRRWLELAKKFKEVKHE